MSMFEMVFPDPHRGHRLGMAISVIGQPHELLTNLRLRDAWIEKMNGDPVMVLYTRNGGGNRVCYCAEHGLEPGTCTGCAGEAATEHPCYLSDADDAFDVTYRTYRFTVGNPDVDDEIRATLLELAEDDPIDMSTRWLAAIDAMAGGK